MIKILISFLVSFFLFPRNLFILILNFNKILKSNKIIIQTEGGFGHCLTIQMCSKLVFKNNFLYILFIEKNRHNEYLPDYFNLNYIIFRNNISVKLNNRNFTIGEKELSKFKVFESFLIKTIYLVKKKNIFINHNIYKFLEKKYKFLKKRGAPDFYRWEEILIHLVKKKKFKLNNNKLKKLLIKNNLEKFFKFEKSKNNNISIYLRNRLNEELFSGLRNGSNKKDYIATFNYLIKKKYNLFIFGDKIFNETDFNNTKGNVVNCNNFNKKENEMIQLYFLSISNKFISEAGGAQYFGPLFERFILINSYPPKLQFTNCFELQKKIFDKRKNKFLNSKQKQKLFWWKNSPLEKRFILKSNKSNEIKYFIKKIIY